MLGTKAQHLGFDFPMARRIKKAGAAPDAMPTEAIMGDRIVMLTLNQQQLELLDRTVARGVAADRAALIRLALREQAEKQARQGQGNSR